MSKIKNPDWLSDLIIDDIMALSEDELDHELTENGLNPKHAVDELRSSLGSLSVDLRKNRFSSIKAELDRKKKILTPDSDRFIEKFLDSGKNAKDFLIEIIASGKAPSDLTVAFRDGKEITDDEAASIIKDLMDLGYIKDL
ncbi:hypothetical protein [Marinobacterium mangrovicola]|uniref:Uncharacterized protein n=1 Tax=Marinobacterium mangrovicola TaxID=1476959 RepID=A0A4R1G5P2_9GAMM|nr:hypothetical protein [Marinobacterium mangrovicola]TCK02974.1 hypothetical protein CLV83_4027 [Marinobacterium mangrovicola]